MSVTTELSDLNREDEEREDIKREEDREYEKDFKGIVYEKPFEGVLDANKVMAERDELSAILTKTLEMAYVLEKRSKRIAISRDECLGIMENNNKIINEFRNLLKMIGMEGKCKGCGVTIYWVMSKNQKAMPITAEGLNHFADCPEADNFRKKK